MSIDITELYQELIIDHGTKPRNFCALTNANYFAEGFNPLCGDKIKLYLLIENDIVLKATFEGVGCAISTASASIMTEMLPGKTTSEALDLFAKFKTLITNEEQNQTKDLGKLLALASVKNFPSRVKCATLSWHTLDAAIKNQEIVASTE
jgi:nitrogen fixation protein NifU and related proteins